MPIRVAIAEDHGPTRARLVAHLAYFPQVTLAAVLGSGDALLERLATMGVAELPDVVLMDIEMPGRSGIETTAYLKQRYPDIDVLMFTVFEDDERLFAAVQAGASGYLLKDTSLPDLVAAVEELRAGGAPLSKPLARRLLQTFQPATASAASPERLALTEREVEVLRLVVEGLSNQEIADRLLVAPGTIKSHVKNIYGKLHVSSRVAATQKALRHGIV